MAGAVISTCGRCRVVFASVEAFDFHRVNERGRRRCLTLAEIRRAGMVQDADGHWKMPARKQSSRSKRLSLARKSSA